MENLLLFNVKISSFLVFFSSYEGWDNPFRPEGELSHEAEELLKLWKQGKLKTHPNDPNSSSKAADQQETEASVVDSAAAAAAAAKTAADTDPLISDQTPSDGGKVKQQQNGGESSLKNGGKSGAPVEVKRENMPQLVNPKHVTLGGKDKLEPKKKKGCCSIM